MQKQDLIIIGGGIAGLYAAWKLADSFNIILLEAQDRFGGRIHSISSNGGILEVGAEFVHGKAERTLELLNIAGINTTTVGGKFLQVENGKWVSDQDPHGGMWDNMLEQLAKATPDQTLGSFLDKNFGAEAQTEFRNSVRAFAEGFDLADADKASAADLYKEWGEEDAGDHRVEGGYVALINFLLYELKDKVDLRLNHSVSNINIDGKKASVTLASGETITAGKILITVPVSLLGGESTGNTIHLPDNMNAYRQAAKNIGFGNVVKIILECSEKFWPVDMGFLISKEIIPTWWTQLPPGKPMLTGWAGGPKATKLKDASETEIKSQALQSLSAIFGLSIEELENKIEQVHVYNWSTNPFSHGAYSYAYPQSAEAKKILGKDFRDLVWFAGEALYDGPHPGTVEAAIVSAEAAVKKILDFNVKPIRF